VGEARNYDQAACSPPMAVGHPFGHERGGHQTTLVPEAAAESPVGAAGRPKDADERAGGVLDSTGRNGPGLAPGAR
jgi:hypothetical protein